jgi:hypothetical protein
LSSDTSPQGDDGKTTGDLPIRQGRRLVARAAMIGAGACAAAVLTASATAARHAFPTFTAQTVPPVSGLVFRFSGRRYTTDAHGTLRIAVRNGRSRRRLNSLLALRHNIRLVWGTTSDGSVFRLDRWYGRPFYRADSFSARATLQLMVPTRFRFIGPNDKPWPLHSIDRVTLKRHDGLITSLPGTAFRHPLLLQGMYTAPNGAGVIQFKNAQYRLEAVIINGSNVVNRGQLAVYPRLTRDVAVHLLFYSLSLKARDRLFKTAIGRGVDLKYPDGHTRYFRFRHGSRVDLEALPRGTYIARVSALALPSATPVSLTKGQAASMAIVSYLDVAVVAGALLITSIGLWWAGHGGLRHARRWLEQIHAK